MHAQSHFCYTVANTHTENALYCAEQQYTIQHNHDWVVKLSRLTVFYQARNYYLCLKNQKLSFSYTLSQTESRCVCDEEARSHSPTVCFHLKFMQALALVKTSCSVSDDICRVLYICCWSHADKLPADEPRGSCLRITAALSGGEPGR